MFWAILNANPPIGIKRCDNAAFEVQPQGYRSMGTDGQSIGGKARQLPIQPVLPQNAASVALS
jgi:hypothetical protein